MTSAMCAVEAADQAFKTIAAWRPALLTYTQLSSYFAGYRGCAAWSPT